MLRDDDPSPSNAPAGQMQAPQDEDLSRSRFAVHRYYDPATEQFLSVDPLVAETGTPYAFTDGDPVNGTDPAGLNDCGIFSVVCDVGHVVSGAAKYVAHHPLQTAGLIAGGIAIATGVEQSRVASLSATLPFPPAPLGAASFVAGTAGRRLMPPHVSRGMIRQRASDWALTARLH